MKRKYLAIIPNAASHVPEGTAQNDSGETLIGNPHKSHELAPELQNVNR